MQTRKIVRTIGFSLFIIAILSISGMVELAASADARNSSSDADTAKSVYANDEDLSTWCTTYSRGHPPPGSWDSSTHTCTVTGSPTMGDVTVSSGETLLISGSGQLTVDSGYTLTINSGGYVSR